MLKRITTIIAFAALLQGAASTSRAPVVQSVLNSVLTTAFHGDTQLTNSSLINLSQRYLQFISSFSWQPECSHQPDVVTKACEIFAKVEQRKVEEGRWSEAYDFEAAAFSGSTGVYNFSRKVPLTGDYFCKITLQLSVDLPAQYILSDEYWAECRVSK